MGLIEKDKILFYIFINAEYYVFYTDEYKGLSQMFYCKISISSFRSFLSQYNLDEQTVLTIYFSLLHYMTTCDYINWLPSFNFIFLFLLI